MQGLLTSLKHLKLDGNNMPHLAVPPPFKNPNKQDTSTSWVKRWDRDKKKEVHPANFFRASRTRDPFPLLLDGMFRCKTFVHGRNVLER